MVERTLESPDAYDSAPHYEASLDEITERRDAETGDPVGVDVRLDVHREREGAPDAERDRQTVRFDVDSAAGVATFHDLTTDAAVTDLSLVAIRVAAEELDAVQDDYDVTDPIATVLDSEYEVVDR